MCLCQAPGIRCRSIGVRTEDGAGALHLEGCVMIFRASFYWVVPYVTGTFLSALLVCTCLLAKQTFWPTQYYHPSFYLFVYLAASGLGCSGWALCCVVGDLPLQWILELWHTSSVVVACRLSCSMAGGILIPWPGIEPSSPALQGRFLTSGPQGKSPSFFSMWRNWGRMKTRGWFKVTQLISVSILDLNPGSMVPWAS